MSIVKSILSGNLDKSLVEGELFARASFVIESAKNSEIVKHSRLSEQTDPNGSNFGLTREQVMQMLMSVERHELPDGYQIPTVTDRGHPDQIVNPQLILDKAKNNTTDKPARLMPWEIQNTIIQPTPTDAGF